MLLDNCTVVTMDAERRILRDAAIVVQGNSIAAVGKSERDPPPLPRGARARPARLGGHARPRRRPHPPAAGDPARLRRRGAAVGLDGGAHLHPRGRVHGRGRPHLHAAGGARDAQGGHHGVPRDAHPRPPRARRPGRGGGGHRDAGRAPARHHRRRRLPRRVPAQQGPVRGAGGGDRGCARGRQAVPRLRADPHLVRAALDGRHLRGAAARARRRSPARRAWACASTTP